MIMGLAVAIRWNLLPERRWCNKCANSCACSSRKRRDTADNFPYDGWNLPDEQRRCKSCVPKRCPNCKKAKRREGFSRRQCVRGQGVAVCTMCDVKRCGGCFKEKGVRHYSQAMWVRDDGDADLRCAECLHDKRTSAYWTCKYPRCAQPQKPIAEFSKYHIRRAGKSPGKQQCDACVSRLEQEDAAQHARELAHMQKRPRHS